MSLATSHPITFKHPPFSGFISLWGIIFFLLTGCHTTSHPPTGSWQAYKDDALSVQTWQAEGKISFSTHGQRSTGSFRLLMRSKKNFSLFLLRPFGGIELELHQTQTGASLITKAQLHEHLDAKALIALYTPYHMPIDAMLYWIRGLPAPNSQAIIRHNEHQMPLNIQQQGWQIEYRTYHQHGPHWPKTIALRSLQENVSIRLIVKTWEILAQTTMTELPTRLAVKPASNRQVT